MTVKTYQGYFLEDGRLMMNGSPIKLPTKCRVIVNVLEDEMEEVGATANVALHKRQAAAVVRFLTSVAELKDEDDVMTDADWEELANLRARTNAGLARSVDI